MLQLAISTASAVRRLGQLVQQWHVIFSPDLSNSHRLLLGNNRLYAPNNSEKWQKQWRFTPADLLIVQEVTARVVEVLVAYCDQVQVPTPTRFWKKPMRMAMMWNDLSIYLSIYLSHLCIIGYVCAYQNRGQRIAAHFDEWITWTKIEVEEDSCCEKKYSNI